MTNDENMKGKDMAILATPVYLCFVERRLGYPELMSVELSINSAIDSLRDNAECDGTADTHSKLDVSGNGERTEFHLRYGFQGLSCNVYYMRKVVESGPVWM